jgi:hypothetical protein
MGLYYILANGNKRQVWHWGRRRFCWDIDADYRSDPQWSYGSLRVAKRRQAEIRKEHPELDIDVFTAAEFDKKWSDA